jgi:hypothetical protein
VFKAAGKGLAAVKRHAGKLDEAVGALSHADDAATATATGVRESIEEASSVLAKEGGGAANSVARPTAASMSDLDFVQRIATKAESTGVRLGHGAAGTGPAQGTWKHGYAKDVLERYQTWHGKKLDLLAEKSYGVVGGAKMRVPHGTPGSSRPDVYNPVTGELFDYKFVRNPGTGLGSRQRARNASNVPGLTSQHEINP